MVFRSLIRARVVLANTVLANPELEQRWFAHFHKNSSDKAFYLVADKLHYESEKVTVREWMLELVKQESAVPKRDNTSSNCIDGASEHV